MNWVCVGFNLLLLTIVLIMGFKAIRNGEVPLNDNLFKRNEEPFFYWVGIGVCLFLIFLIVSDIGQRLGLF